ncbi:MAG: membrane dipeptidase [Synergistaceae bacterium]|nr:membrane dipeptidase [Synergistaceae bacterium]
MYNMLLDAHFDVLLDVLSCRKKGERKVLERRHFQNLKEAGISTIICSLYISDIFLPEGALRNALDQISALEEELEESRELFSLCRNSSEAKAASEKGKIGLFLSLEGAEPLVNDIFLLRTFYDLGVRLVGLTWSRRNYAGDGSSFDPADAPRHPGGLTKFGRELVMEAQKMGMVIDVSHLNDPGFYEVAELMKTPFIASHSNCRALCGSARNLKDDQIKMIAESGGVIGLNAYSPFVSDNEADRNTDKFFEHLQHITQVAGIDNVGLGLDLCDCIVSLAMGNDDSRQKDLFTDHLDASRRFIVPLKKKLSHGDYCAFTGGNFMRVIERVLG